MSAQASDDDWNDELYLGSLRPHLVVDGAFKQPVGFIPLRTLVSEKRAKRLRRKQRNKKPD